MSSAKLNSRQKLEFNSQLQKFSSSTRTSVCNATPVLLSPNSPLTLALRRPRTSSAHHTEICPAIPFALPRPFFSRIPILSRSLCFALTYLPFVVMSRLFLSRLALLSPSPCRDLSKFMNQSIRSRGVLEHAATIPSRTCELSALLLFF